MTRFRPLLLIALALAPSMALAQPALLALYQDRGNASTRLHNLIDNVPLGGALVDCCATVQGTLTYNPASREILLVQQTVAGQEIVRISAATGTVAGRVAVAAGWQLLAAAYDRTRASLFVIARNDSGNRHLATIMPTTGVVSTIGAALPTGITLVPGGHGLHPRRGQWHLLVHADTSASGQRVITLALTGGSVLRDSAINGYTLSNLTFDEGSGRLLGMGRANAGQQTQLLWLDPGSGEVTGLTPSGIPNCCAFSMGSLAAIAAEAAVGNHYLMSDGTTLSFMVWSADTGGVLGSLPHAQSWAIHGLVVDQTVFIGDHLFYDGFEVVAKPTGFEEPE